MRNINLHWLYDSTHPLLFSSVLFLFLFLVFYLIYINLLGSKIRNIYVLLFSLYVYYMAGGEYILLLLLSTIVNYVLSTYMHRAHTPSQRKVRLIFIIILNLLVLGYFKYCHFFIDNVNTLFHLSLAFKKIALPVGISFYTFQIISYQVDLYRKEIEPVKNMIDFGFFVCYFPQLVAGPIVRAKDFLYQMYEPLKLNKEQVSLAFFLILLGLFKKAVISDYISSNFVDRIFDTPLGYSPIENLLACYGYALQIYCDFSGYSDMAIGLALLMGFRLPDNFHTPYKSTSVTEFWKRWHISLSSWLKDYLYISLGGNRKGKVRTYINLILTMLIGGLWHGAAWKFIVWGGLHGLALAIERIFKQYLHIPHNWFSRLIGMIITFHFVVFCWIFFRAASFDMAWKVLGRIKDLSFVPQQWFAVIHGYKHVFILIGVGFLLHFAPESLTNKMKHAFYVIPWPLKSLIVALVFYLVYATASSGTQPFIYFQF